MSTAGKVEDWGSVGEEVEDSWSIVGQVIACTCVCRRWPLSCIAVRMLTNGTRMKRTDSQ